MNPPRILLTTLEAAIAAGVTAATIRTWRRRGKLIPAGYDHGRGHAGRVALWDLRDVQRASNTTMLDAVSRKGDTLSEPSTLPKINPPARPAPRNTP